MLDITDDDDTLTTADSNAPPGPDGPTRVTRELGCELTDSETRERGEEMAAAEREVDRLKDRRKALNAQIRGKLDRMTVLAKAIDSHKEVRDVPCTWRPDYQRKVWELTRDDVQKVIEHRPMGAVDMQTRLPLESAADAADGDDGDDGDDGVDYDADVGGLLPDLAANDTASDGDGGDPAYVDDPIPGYVPAKRVARVTRAAAAKPAKPAAKKKVKAAKRGR